MKYRLVVVLLFALSTEVSAGFLDKVSKAASVVDQGLKAVAPESEISAQKPSVTEQSVVPEKSIVVKKEAQASAPAPEAKPSDREAEIQRIRDELESSRSGTIVFSGELHGTPTTLQWGDSADVINKLCGIYLENLPDYLFGRAGRELVERQVKVFVDRDVGLFQVEIVFPARQFGGVVGIEELKSKYINEYGKPENLRSESGEQTIGYRWVGQDKTVVVGYNSGNISIEEGTLAMALPKVTLTSPDMNQKREMAVKARADKQEKARKEAAAKALDF